MGQRKVLVWLHGEVRSPPCTDAARQRAGELLRTLQRGEALGMPQSRPMPSIGARCHELRVPDGDLSWRIVHRIDPDAIIGVEIFPRTTTATPDHILRTCRERLRRYDDEQEEP